MSIQVVSDRFCARCKHPELPVLHTCGKSGLFPGLTQKTVQQALNAPARLNSDKLLPLGRVRVDGKVYEWSALVSAWLLVLDE